jgi:ABC-type dipeptide/oligopeptide/nickel transport system permease component
MFGPYLLWSLQFLVYPPFCFITLAIAVDLLASVFIQKPFGQEIWKRKYSLAILQFACFPATLLVAAFGAVSGPEPNNWGLRAVDALAFISLGVGIYWIGLMKGLRWYAISVVVLQVWLLAGANFVAGMALTGRWL